MWEMYDDKRDTRLIYAFLGIMIIVVTLFVLILGVYNIIYFIDGNIPAIDLIYRLFASVGMWTLGVLLIAYIQKTL